MTERDLLVIDFINLIGICRTNHIKQLFFKDCHVNVWHRRAGKLEEYGELKRFRSPIFESEYVYYSDKKPHARLLRHDMYITDLVTELVDAGAEIIEFERNVCIGDLISDAFLVYRFQKDGKYYKVSALIEVQLSNKLSDCTLKYNNEDIIREFAETKGLKALPRLVIISDLKGDTKCKLKVVHLNTELNNLVNSLL
jgi:hypothetical protein